MCGEINVNICIIITDYIKKTNLNISRLLKKIFLSLCPYFLTSPPPFLPSFPYFIRS